MRKLTVKNFSVIKDATLEFGKITVLIGPQASGKSLLCKLTYFLGGEIIAIAVESLLNKNSWDEFLQTVARDFVSWFSTAGWLKTSFRASFSSQQYTVELRGVGDPLNPGIEFTFSNEFKKLYVMIGNNPAKQPSYTDMSRSELRQDLWVELILLLNGKRTQANIYIPSGRAFFTDPGKSVSALQNPDLDQITRRFAGQIAWDTRWKAGLLTTDRDVVRDLEKEIARIAGGVVVMMDGKPRFLSFDGRNLPLSMQSSGTQELLPMFSVVDYLACHQEHFYARAASRNISPLAEISDHSPLVYLEEPEAHVFPKTQYDLVKLFGWLAKDSIIAFDWVITTHSPYILSAFGNLLKAGKVGAQSAENHAAVEKTVAEKYWIKNSDFAAYKIENGALTSIFDKETGQIDGDYLDNVSSDIAEEFGQLLEIQYGG